MALKASDTSVIFQCLDFRLGSTALHVSCILQRLDFRLGSTAPRVSCPSSKLGRVIGIPLAFLEAGSEGQLFDLTITSGNGELDCERITSWKR
ncbi:MAG TPA: hypothetical protein VHI32_04100 [Burkholderiales bacterium]|nr:hypothetical protein [Burkholderiales bacterium]